MYESQVIEVELAKLKVMVNDIQAHQSSVDTLNDAGRQIIESDKGSREASNTQQKLNELNTKWNELLGAAEGRQVELEDALKEAQAFAQEIQVSHMFTSMFLCLQITYFLFCISGHAVVVERRGRRSVQLQAGWRSARDGQRPAGPVHGGVQGA